MLDIERVTVVLGGATVLSGVSARVERGGWLGVIGPNGAGKSTLVRAVTGLLPYEGEIRIAGDGVRQVRPAAPCTLGRLRAATAGVAPLHERDGLRAPGPLGTPSSTWEPRQRGTVVSPQRCSNGSSSARLPSGCSESFPGANPSGSCSPVPWCRKRRCSSWTSPRPPWTSVTASSCSSSLTSFAGRRGSASCAPSTTSPWQPSTPSACSCSPAAGRCCPGPPPRC